MVCDFTEHLKLHPAWGGKKTFFNGKLNGSHISLLGLPKQINTNWVVLTADTYCLTVLEARSLRSSISRYSSFWGLWMKELFIPGLCPPPVYGCFLPISLYIFPLCMSVSKFSLCISAQATLDWCSPQWPHFNTITSVIRSHLRYWGLGLQHRNLEKGTQFNL